FFCPIYCFQCLFSCRIGLAVADMKAKLTTKVVLNIFGAILLITQFGLNLSLEKGCRCLTITRMQHMKQGCLFVIVLTLKKGSSFSSTILVAYKPHEQPLLR